MTLEQRMNHGEQARAVLENEAFTRAFDNIEQEHIESWKNSPARDAQGRETLWMSVRLLHKLKATLEAEMTDGRLAQDQLQHLEQQTAQSLREHLGTF